MPRFHGLTRSLGVLRCGPWSETIYSILVRIDKLETASISTCTSVGTAIIYSQSHLVTDMGTTEI
jgi:hypothetical protein